MVSHTYLCSYYFAFAKSRRDIVSEYMRQMRYIVLSLQVCPITHSHSGLYWLTEYPERELPHQNRAAFSSWLYKKVDFIL